MRISIEWIPSCEGMTLLQGNDIMGFYKAPTEDTILFRGRLHYKLTHDISFFDITIA